jgi:hypothetical protein
VRAGQGEVAGNDAGRPRVAEAGAEQAADNVDVEHERERVLLGVAAGEGGFATAG